MSNASISQLAGVSFGLRCGSKASEDTLDENGNENEKEEEESQGKEEGIKWDGC